MGNHACLRTLYELLADFVQGMCRRSTLAGIQKLTDRHFPAHRRADESCSLPSIHSDCLPWKPLPSHIQRRWLAASSRYPADLGRIWCQRVPPATARSPNT